MATQQIFSIYDRKAAAYMQPFFSANVETAKRSVTDSLQSNPVQHVADYDLFLIGEWDDISGSIISVVPTFIAPCLALRSPPIAASMDQDESVSVDDIRDAFHEKMRQEEQEELLQTSNEDLKHG